MRDQLVITITFCRFNCTSGMVAKPECHKGAVLSQVSNSAYQAAMSSLTPGVGGCVGRCAGLPCKSGWPEPHRASLSASQSLSRHVLIDRSRIRTAALACSPQLQTVRRVIEESSSFEGIHEPSHVNPLNSLCSMVRAEHPCRNGRGSFERHVTPPSGIQKGNCMAPGRAPDHHRSDIVGYGLNT